MKKYVYFISYLTINPVTGFVVAGNAECTVSEKILSNLQIKKIQDNLRNPGGIIINYKLLRIEH